MFSQDKFKNELVSAANILTHDFFLDFATNDDTTRYICPVASHSFKGVVMENVKYVVCNKDGFIIAKDDFADIEPEILEKERKLLDRQVKQVEGRVMMNRALMLKEDEAQNKV